MKHRLGFTVFLLLLLGVTAVAQDRGAGETDGSAQRRVALVIGNDDYEGESRLYNAVRDASDMGQALTDLGFETTTRKNLTRDEMIGSIREFVGNIQGGVGLFYYAGHGVQINGENFLIPVNARLSSEADVAVESVGLDFLLRRMEEARGRLGIIFLDACRNNPLPRNVARSAARGLAPLSKRAGMLIVYSTATGEAAQDGQKGGNSVFTQELLKNIKRPGVEVRQMIQDVRKGVAIKTRQMPWEESALLEDFYFNPAPGQRPKPGAPAEASAASAAGHRVKDHIWVFRPDENYGPTFYEFLPDGSVKTRHRYRGDSRQTEAGEWYQTGSSVHLVKRKYPRNSLTLERSCKGEIRGDRIEGLCKVTGSDQEGNAAEKSYPWVLIKTDQ